jgi:ubiquinone/menaquinone biosynthesis C-methylase UbiE
MLDYTEVTEQPGTLLSADQLHRYAQRYALAAEMAVGKRVLEVACGAGGGLALMEQAAHQIVGLDCTWHVLTHAQRAATAPLMQADAQALPVKTNHFDLVVCFEALYYLDDYQDFMRECRRVLAPGGRVLLCESNPDWHAFAPGALSTRYPGALELVEALRSGGFRAIELHGALPSLPGVGRAALVNRLRRIVLRTGLVRHLRRWAPLLMQLGYGQLTPLPLTLEADQARAWSAGMALTPLDPTRPDRIHRVIFAQGVV